MSLYTCMYLINRTNIFFFSRSSCMKLLSLEFLSLCLSFFPFFYFLYFPPSIWEKRNEERKKRTYRQFAKINYSSSWVYFLFYFILYFICQTLRRERENEKETEQKEKRRKQKKDLSRIECMSVIKPASLNIIICIYTIPETVHKLCVWMNKWTMCAR